VHIPVLRALACAFLITTVSAPVRGLAASLAGQYDGGQMEVGAALWLKPDGHFRYELSYGALDEQASGRWTASGDKVLLTSDPVKAPRISIVSQKQGAPGALRITMDVKDPYDQQYFNAIITTASGEFDNEQLGIDGLNWPFPSTEAPTAVRLINDVYQIASEPVKLDAGAELIFHFEANDLGKADFRGTPLQVEGDVLVLKRFGLTLKFRRKGPRHL
jgi:hypothetical protein